MANEGERRERRGRRGMTVEEFAAATGLTVTGVKQVIMRLRQQGKI